jgi:hypothetical protein
MGTPLLHKTPLPDPRRNATELTQLSHRLAEGPVCGAEVACADGGDGVVPAWW